MEQREGTGSELQQAELAAGGLREPAEAYACALLVRNRRQRLQRITERGVHV